MSGVDDREARELAGGAERLINDPLLRSLLDEMIQINTEKAITGAEATQREDGRQQVLAIMALRANLGVLVSNWTDRAAIEQRRRASE
jgi:hypothetical protein